MTRLSVGAPCTACGGLLVPIEMASTLDVPATTDYICANCRQPYSWTSGHPPRLTALLLVVGQKGATDSATLRPTLHLPVNRLVVIADGHEDTREMYALCLEHHGFQVEEAPSGVAAIQLTQRLRPALVVIDVRMPTMDGISAIRRIRSRQALRDIPILALTTDERHQTEALAAGATVFCMKPCTPDKLLAQVCGLLKRGS
jgi:CheY-like chemotaxis protein